MISLNKNKGPLIDLGLCRCCGAAKKCRLLNVEYEWSGQKEVYSDMFLDCFGLLLSHLDGEAEERLICATCVVRLRDAVQFRGQVLRCEEVLLKKKINTEANENKRRTDLNIKEEEVDDNNLEECYTEDYDTNHRNEINEQNEVKLKSDVIIKVEQVNDSSRGGCCDENFLQENGTKIDVRKLEKIQIDGTSLLRSSKNREARAKAELLNKIKRLRNRVIKLRNKEATSIKPLVRLVKKTDPDEQYERNKINATRNAIILIENSYLCPFLTIYSDYYCVYCREMFIEPDVLREHTHTHDPKTYRNVIDSRKNILVDIHRIECRHCPSKFDSVDDLKRHLSDVHGKVFAKVSDEFLKFKLKSGKMSCTRCDKSFNFFQALKKHMAVHFGTWVCDVCGAHYFEERMLVLHKKQVHKSEDEAMKMYACPECGKNLKSMKSRNEHIAKIHRNDPIYSCNKCDKLFLSHHLRYKHKMDEHGELRTFPCESCDKVYNSRKSLREHTKKNHLLLLKHECSHCDRKFYLPSQLKDHMISHTGERNFRCEFCGKCYPRLKTLKIHMESHSSEKKYKCTVCSAAYTQLNNFKNHMKSKHQDVGLPCV